MRYFRPTKKAFGNPSGLVATLRLEERNYSAPERECLAVVYGITICPPYLYGERFTVRTGYAALRWLVQISDPSGRLMRWRLRIAEYSFDVQYKKAKWNCQADTVSRIPSLFHTVAEDDAEIPCYAVTHDSEEDGDMDAENDLYFDEHDRVAQQAPDFPKPVDPFKVDELVIAQQKEPFCDSRRAEIDLGKPTVFRDEPHTELLMRHVYDYPQIVVPVSMQERLFRSRIRHNAPVTPGDDAFTRRSGVISTGRLWLPLAVSRRVAANHVPGSVLSYDAYLHR